ncbi:MAG: germination protein YpeB [Clostridiales bacterium]|nr:germination protein YpeB [Clostridiales bacterium]
MKEPLSRRGRVRTLTFLAAAFVVLCGIAINLAAQNIHYRRATALSYARAFSQLTDSVDKLDAALEKSVYVTSANMISALCTELYGEALTAQQAIGELPYGNVELEQTAAFVAKVGDYAQALSKSTARRGGYSAEELENVKQLSQAASTLSGQLDELEAQLNDGTLELEDVAAVEERLSRLTEDGDVLAGSSYESVESDFPKLPTLIYDGPFSEHLQSRESAMLKDEDTLTLTQAQEKAADLLGLEREAFSDGREVNGELPCYAFSYTQNGGDCTISVTKQGGYLLSLSKERAIGAETLTTDEAVEKAKAFLAAHGIDDMTESYFIDQGNRLTINFAARQEDVICYPDLIKVEVAMDNGEIVGCEAAGYLMNHTRRSALQPWVSAGDAQEQVSGELSVLSRQLALIPTEGENEVLCWEFKCENGDGKHYIVYINAKTGEEQQILILLEDESGTLTL